MAEDICGILSSTLSSDINVVKKAEQNVKTLSSDPNFVKNLMILLFEKECQEFLKISAAIVLKNLIIQNWPETPDEITLLSPDFRNHFKNKIIIFYANSPKKIQSQIVQTIVHIAQIEFPQRWETLLPNIAGMIEKRPMSESLPLLKLLSSLFDKYLHECASPQLWTEVKYVLDNFAQPLTLFFQKHMVELNNMNPSTIPFLFKSLKYVIRIFHCLTSQDFPEYFEDHKEEWWGPFIMLLKMRLDSFSQYGGNIIPKFMKVKARIINVTTMFLHKYFEDIQSHVNTFVETIWQIAIYGIHDCDELAIACINFLRVAFSTPSMSKIFEQKDNVLSLCGNILLPNIAINDNEKEKFEDDPDEYVRCEIEGNLGSRNSITADFICTISYTYESTILPIFLEYANQLITKYRENPIENWRYKDSALRILIAISMRVSTLNFGPQKLPEVINFNTIFTNMILPELSMSTHPIVLASSIKYLINFQKFISPDLINQGLSTYASFLAHPQSSVRLFSCILFEGIFLELEPLPESTDKSIDIIKVYPDQTKRVSKVSEILTALYPALLQLIKPSRESCSESPFKCMISLLAHTQSSSSGYLLYILENLISLINAFSSYSLSPNYVHYYYECMSLTIRMIRQYLPEQSNELFQQIITPLYNAMDTDVRDSCDYVIQIFSIILRRTKVDALYKPLISKLLFIDFWEGDCTKAHSNSLLLDSLAISCPEILMGNNVAAFIEIFKKLSAHPRYDSVSYHIPCALLNLPWPNAQAFPTDLFLCFFGRMTSLKKPKYVAGFSVFIYKFLVKFGVSEFYRIVESIQPTIIFKIIEGVLFFSLESSANQQHKRSLCLCLAQILFWIPELFSQNQENWSKFVNRLVRSNPPSEPQIHPIIAKYYSLLGNKEPDLIWTQLNTDSHQNILRFTYSDELNNINVKNLILEQINEMKPRIGEQIYQYIVNTN